MRAIVHRYRRSFLFLIALLCVAIALLIRELGSLPDGRLQVRFLDAGQGDATLLITPTGRTILIDGGPDLSVLEGLGRNLPLAERSIDLLIVTHPDPDHITAFPEVLNRYDVGALMIPPVENDEPRYMTLLRTARERRVPVVIADPKRDIRTADGLTLDFLWPSLPLSFKDDNDNSVVLRATFATGSILFTGDLGAKAEAALLSSGTDVAADVLKVGHHGSKTSTSEEFLDAVRPRLAVIMVGKDNSFGHPDPRTLGRLAARRIPVRLTSEEGEIALGF